MISRFATYVKRENWEWQFFLLFVMLSENDIDFRVISREMDKYTRFGGDQKFTTKR